MTTHKITLTILHILIITLQNPTFTFHIKRADLESFNFPICNDNYVCVNQDKTREIQVINSHKIKSIIRIIEEGLNANSDVFENMAVVPGNNVTIPCMVASNNSTNVWLQLTVEHSGVLFSGNTRVRGMPRMHLNQASLVIAPVLGEDLGTYQCIALHQQKKRKSNTNLKIDCVGAGGRRQDLLCLSWHEGEERRGWQEARGECFRRGGDLLQVDLGDEKLGQKIMKAYDGIIGDYQNFWIGVSRVGSKLVDLKSFEVPEDHPRWEAGYPEYAGFGSWQCVYMRVFSNRPWTMVTSDCSREKNFMCSYDQ